VQISSALARLISQGPGVAIGLPTEDLETLQLLIAWLNTSGNHCVPTLSRLSLSVGTQK
jgi:hypothetical protein